MAQMNSEEQKWAYDAVMQAIRSANPSTSTPIPVAPFSDLKTIYLFKTYSTREQFALEMGYEPLPYNPSKPVKSWCDLSVVGQRKIMYKCLALAENGAPLANEQGKPFLEQYLLTGSEASSVNLKPKSFQRDTNIVELPESGVEVPVPCRDLMDYEELVFGFGGEVKIRNLKVPLDQSADGPGFTQKDREILYKIAAKLNLL
jgi:hypothetical protein